MADLIIKTCPGCGTDFQTENKNQKYCTRKCMQHHYYLLKTVQKRKEEEKNYKVYHINCVRCGKEFDAYDIRQKYCSNECRLSPKPKKYKKICIRCGKEFETSRKHKLHCSKECFFEGQKEQAERKYQEKVCPICGKTFKGHFNSVYCSEECVKAKNRLLYYGKKNRF